MRRKISKILKFVRLCKNLVFKRIRLYSSKFSKKTYTQHQHIVLNCLKIRFNEDYRDMEDIINEMPGIQKELNLSSVPHFTTLQKAFQRLKSKIFNLLILLSAKLTEFSGNAGVDATGHSFSFRKWCTIWFFAKRKMDPFCQRQKKVSQSEMIVPERKRFSPLFKTL